MKHVRDEIFKDTMRKQKGEWRDFLRSVDFDVTTAKRFIKVYEEFGKDSDTWHRLNMRNLYEIATLPPEERDVPHELPTGETKKPDEMTVRELRELKRQLRQAENQAEAERQERERLEKENTELASTDTKLQRDDLKPGQKAAIVIRLLYHDLSIEAERRMLTGVKNPSADLHSSSDMPGDVAEILAKKVGMSRRNLYYLLAVYRNRLDLFELVFDGSYSINKA